MMAQSLIKKRCILTCLWKAEKNIPVLSEWVFVWRIKAASPHNLHLCQPLCYYYFSSQGFAFRSIQVEICGLLISSSISHSCELFNHLIDFIFDTCFTSAFVFKLHCFPVTVLLIQVCVLSLCFPLSERPPHLVCSLVSFSPGKYLQQPPVPYWSWQTLSEHNPCKKNIFLIWNRVDCQRSEKRSKTHKRLKERFLMRQNRTKPANFQGSPLFQSTYNNTTENS